MYQITSNIVLSLLGTLDQFEKTLFSHQTKANWITLEKSLLVVTQLEVEVEGASNRRDHNLYSFLSFWLFTNHPKIAA